MSKYTEKVHGKRLLKMLRTKKPPCWCCPASIGFIWSNETIKRYRETSQSEVCNVCRSFVEIKEDDPCPCNYFGSTKAIEISWEMLKKKGFCK